MIPPPRFVVLTPMREELEAVLALGKPGAKRDLSGFECVEMTFGAGRRVIVVRCGVGKTLAAMITQQVIGAYRPGAVILTGVAGALASDLAPGDAVVARDLLHHDMDCTALGFARGEVPFTGERVFTCDPALVSAALTARVGHGLRAGRILTGDRFVTHADKACHAYLTGELAGDAVEMEGAAVGQVCSRNGIPFVVVRTISDRADGAAPEDFSKILPLAAANAAAVTRSILES